MSMRVGLCLSIETGFDYGDALAGVGVGLRHQVHADHEAARDDDANDERFVPTGCPNCPRCHRLTRNAFRSLRIVVSTWDTALLSQCLRCPRGRRSLAAPQDEGVVETS